MVAAYPVVKLAALLIRQISKPLANTIKERAKQKYFFRTYVCMPPAQFYHWCEVRSRMWIMGMGKGGDVPKLNESMAIDLGANMLGEGVIFGVAAVLLIFEYNRSSNKEAAREMRQQERLQLLESRLDDMRVTIERRDAELRHISRRVLGIHACPCLKSPAGCQEPDKEGGGGPSTTGPSIEGATATPARLESAVKQASALIKGS